MEEIMTKRSSLLVCLLVCAFACPALRASSTAQPKPFEPATIVSVHKQEIEEPPYYGGDNPSDAPLQSEVYAYDVAVHTACGVYVARWEAPYDYFPQAIAVNRQMPVRIGKHDIAFDLGYRQMQMPIAHRHKDKSANCR
jgi:hypothetical protein